MKKKLLLSMAGVIVIITGTIVWQSTNHFNDFQIEEQSVGEVMEEKYVMDAEDRDVKEFMEEKYGMDAVSVSENEPDFVNGHSYQMAFEEQKDVVFTVTVDVENYSTIYRDDYQAVRTLHQVRQQVEKLMPTIEAFGFTAPSQREPVEHVVKSMRTGEAVRWLNLETDDSYETIERPEIQEMKNLLDLQRQNSIDIQKIIIHNKKEDILVQLDLRTMEDVHSLEEVEAHVIGNDLRLAGKRMQTKWQDAATQAETERFRFHDEWNDQWISCHQVNDDGDCINLLANVTFAPGELSQQNPHLEEDLNAIFDFFDSIQPKLMAVDLVMTDPEREGNPVRFFLRERKKYASTEQLIHDLVKD